MLPALNCLSFEALSLKKVPYCDYWALLVLRHSSGGGLLEAD